MIEEKALHKFWWLWLPLIGVIVQAVLELSFDPQTLSVLHSENGPHEILQFIVMCLALLVALRTLWVMDRRAHYGLTAWIALAALCCFYVAGEEVSWGQHLLNWATPEFWATVNDQQETNLHNTTSWLDQKPRLLLEAAVMIGGLLIPALRIWRPGALPARFASIYPPSYLCVVAGATLLFKLLDTKADILGVSIFVRASEVIELYLYYFVLLYLLYMKNKLRRA